MIYYLIILLFKYKSMIFLGGSIHYEKKKSIIEFN